MYFYLLNRRGYYHFRLRVPSDLTHVFTCAEFVKSLKTTDHEQARIVARSYLQRFQSTFSMFRAGIIDRTDTQREVDFIFGRSRKVLFPEANVREPAPPFKDTRPKLSFVISAFVSDKEQGWTFKTKMENDASFRLILDLVGDTPIDNVDRKTVNTLRDSLTLLPANVYKICGSSDANQVLEEIKTRRVTYAPMSTTTVNKHLSRFSSLLSYSVSEGFRTTNPARGMILKRKRKPDEERKTYTHQDLKLICENLHYVEGAPERYWIPLLGMYTGLRLDEICQLYTEDVKEYEGVACINVTDTKDKKVKTLSSRRLVPVHPILVKLGFLEYVRKAAANGQPRLWMNLKRRDADGYGSAYGKVYQRFNRKYVTADPLKTFHSFRHTFADTLKQEGVRESLIAELMGHSNSSVTTGRYGKRYQPKILLEALRKLSFNL